MDFRFSKPYAGDYRIGLIRTPSFSVALAVATSSAFPPVLSPVILDLDPASFERVPGADLYETIGYRSRVVLTDGGVYDNLGLETVWKRYQTVLTGDAGAPFGLFPDPGTSWYRQTFRSFDIATNQARGLRKRLLIDSYQAGVRRGTYWGIMTEIAGYGSPTPCQSRRRSQGSSPGCGRA